MRYGKVVTIGGLVFAEPQLPPFSSGAPATPVDRRGRLGLSRRVCDAEIPARLASRHPPRPRGGGSLR